MGVLRDANFSPTLWLKKLKYIYFRYIKLIFWQNLFIWSFSAYFHCSKPTEAAAVRLWCARWRHFQPIRGRLSRNPLSRNTHPHCTVKRGNKCLPYFIWVILYSFIVKPILISDWLLSFSLKTNVNYKTILMKTKWKFYCWWSTNLNLYNILGLKYHNSDMCPSEIIQTIFGETS